MDEDVAQLVVYTSSCVSTLCIRTLQQTNISCSECAIKLAKSVVEFFPDAEKKELETALKDIEKTECFHTEHQKPCGKLVLAQVLKCAFDNAVSYAMTVKGERMFITDLLFLYALLTSAFVQIPRESIKTVQDLLNSIKLKFNALQGPLRYIEVSKKPSEDKEFFKYVHHMPHFTQRVSDTPQTEQLYTYITHGPKRHVCLIGNSGCGKTQLFVEASKRMISGDGTQCIVVESMQYLVELAKSEKKNAIHKTFAEQIFDKFNLVHFPDSYYTDFSDTEYTKLVILVQHCNKLDASDVDMIALHYLCSLRGVKIVFELNLDVYADILKNSKSYLRLFLTEQCSLIKINETNQETHVSQTKAYFSDIDVYLSDAVIDATYDLCKQHPDLHLATLKSMLMTLENIKNKLKRSEYFDSRLCDPRKFVSMKKYRQYPYHKLTKALNDFTTHSKKVVITTEHLCAYFSSKLCISITLSVDNLSVQQRTMLLEQRLKNRVFGQDEAIEAVVKSVGKGLMLGETSDNKPIACLLFGGVSGVGKTSMAEEIALTMFGPNRCSVFNCQELKDEQFANSRLLGSAAGYIGSDVDGALATVMKKSDKRVLLFDEMDLKSLHLLSLLLAATGEMGIIVDNRNNELSFKHCIIIITTNMGQEHLIIDNDVAKKLELMSEEERRVDKQRRTVACIDDMHLPLQTMTRIDEIIVFNLLGPETIHQIIVGKLLYIQKVLAKQKIIFKWTPELVKHFEDIYSYKLGGRKLKTKIEQTIFGVSRHNPTNNLFVTFFDGCVRLTDKIVEPET